MQNEQNSMQNTSEEISVNWWFVALLAVLAVIIILDGAVITQVLMGMRR